MRSEPTINISCDKENCQFEMTLELTTLARGGYDERNIDDELIENGWIIEDAKDICPDCAEEEIKEVEE